MQSDPIRHVYHAGVTITRNLRPPLADDLGMFSNAVLLLWMCALARAAGDADAAADYLALGVLDVERYGGAAPAKASLS